MSLRSASVAPLYAPSLRPSRAFSVIRGTVFAFLPFWRKVFQEKRAKGFWRCCAQGLLAFRGVHRVKKKATQGHTEFSDSGLQVAWRRKGRKRRGKIYWSKKKEVKLRERKKVKEIRKRKFKMKIRKKEEENWEMKTSKMKEEEKMEKKKKEVNLKSIKVSKQFDNLWFSEIWQKIRVVKDGLSVFHQTRSRKWSWIAVLICHKLLAHFISFFW